MIFGIIVTAISFLLDAFLSMYIPISVTNYNLFIPMFTIISLIIIFPYFNDEYNKFLITCFIAGLFYDITFTNTFGLNAILFLSIGYLIIFLNDNLSNSLFSLIIKMFIVIIIYDVITYLVLSILNYIDYSFITLLIKLGKSVILNIIYLAITYFITNCISKKMHIKKSI